MENQELTDELSKEFLQESCDSLIIQPDICLLLDVFGLEFTGYRGQYLGIHSFDIQIFDLSGNSDQQAKAGLLRLDHSDGGLQRELTIRQKTVAHRMVTPLLFHQQGVRLSFDISKFSTLSSTGFLNQANQIEKTLDLTKHDLTDNLDNNLSEDFLEELYLDYDLNVIEISNATLCLNYLPEQETTLETWFGQTKGIEEILTTTIQFCQFASYLNQQGWCFGQINPKAIAITKPITFYDLTGIFPIGCDRKGIAGNYCPPELAAGYTVDEQTSSYLVGLVFYQATHNCLPIHHQSTAESSPFIQPIPGIYQILSVCLAANGDRPTLQQILSLLVELQKGFKRPEIHWQAAGKSTLGLSINRLQNEDAYGVHQQYLTGESEPFILGVLADGMGGMEKGEIASKMAVKDLIEAQIPKSLKGNSEWAKWLTSLVQKANDEIVKAVRNGGTTLSAVLAVGRELAIAHVGDSRIFLIRKGFICQLSEDHSLVSTLLTLGQINYEESLKHPDRNILTRSLGSQAALNSDQIQTLKSFGKDYSLILEDHDIILICSDGIWDLIEPPELSQIFMGNTSLLESVNNTIGLVLSRGATDNATILALLCKIPECPQL
jgi:PPM family protein phosphatase